MTIIDFMRQKLTEYPKISEFLVDGDIHVDFTEPGSSYGLSSNGDSLVKEDMLGNQTRRMRWRRPSRITAGWSTAISSWNWDIGWSSCQRRVGLLPISATRRWRPGL